MAGVSVIIVNWNARDVLRDCLRSLERHPPPDPWEVIVVDNGSRDGSVEMLRDEMPWVRLIANRGVIPLAVLSAHVEVVVTP